MPRLFVSPRPDSSADSRRVGGASGARVMRRRAPTLCLSLALLGCWNSLPEGVRAQDKGAAATAQAAEAPEAAELRKQAAKLSEAGRHADAVPLAERALALNEKAFGPDHPFVAGALNNLAELYRAQADYARAEPLLQRAVAIFEKAGGGSHPVVAVALSNLAALHKEKGDYARAGLLFRRALDIFEKALGPDDPRVAVLLNNLALVYGDQGDYARAELLLQRALAVTEKALGPEHQNVATALGNLAELYANKGDYAGAAPLYRRAISVTEKALGPDHPAVATPLSNLAALYRAGGDYAGAEQLYRRALAVLKAFGPEHPNVATVLGNLAALYRAQGDYAQAEPLQRRALAAFEKTLGPTHPNVARSLGDLAETHRARGDYARAEPLLRRALAVAEALGPRHPLVADALNNLAVLHTTEGDVPRALPFWSRALEAREANLSLILAAGSERQKLAYLTTLLGETYGAVSLHARYAPSDRRAAELALTTILRRKGRALDAMSDQVASLRRRLDPQDRDLLDRLSAAQTRQSALALGGPGRRPPEEHRADIARLEAEAERLQNEIGRRSAEFAAQARPVTVGRVREALPAGAALVEFFSYQPFDTKARTRAEKYGAARYVAYVLRGGGEPSWVEVGEAKSVDADAAKLRAALRCPGERLAPQQCPGIPEVKRLARALDERVMRPVRQLLGGARRVFVSPDGALNLVPFAALVDERGRYLVESHSFTYLTSGRDLLRLQLQSADRQPPLVVADPLFDPAQPGEGESGEGARRSADMARMSFGRLSGTVEEARALGAILPGARVLTQAAATEAALKQASGPRVLHVATHGFFLSDQPQAAPGETRGIRLAAGGETPTSVPVENPLLRSGLALEGANRRRGANGEDGILTALEAAGLDLRGTKLVILSACETGLGEVRNGEGVYGLRRALVLAGSESQVMTLWQVADEATRDLIVSYYGRLLAGEGRTEALRRVQLDILRGAGRNQPARKRGLSVEPGDGPADRGHPYYWAAFIQSGDWRGMSLKPAGGESGRDRP
jgi:CHAT domain-containing protein/tetratricopeptide (TPR) repeat protein